MCTIFTWESELPSLLRSLKVMKRETTKQKHNFPLLREVGLILYLLGWGHVSKSASKTGGKKEREKSLGEKGNKTLRGRKTKCWQGGRTLLLKKQTQEERKEEETEKC